MGGGALQRLETTLGRGGWAEPAGLAGAQGFSSWRWLAGSMTVGGPRWEDRRLSQPLLTFPQSHQQRGPQVLGNPRRKSNVVSCKLLRETKYWIVGRGREGRERRSSPHPVTEQEGEVGDNQGMQETTGPGSLIPEKDPQLGQKPALGRGNKGRYKGSRGSQDWLQS